MGTGSEGSWMQQSRAPLGLPVTLLRSNMRATMLTPADTLPGT